MSHNNLSLGKQGEGLAARALRGEGYSILAMNYRTVFGEIDIIARDKGVTCFVEVKTRSSSRFGKPEEAVGVSKQRQIAKVALSYLQQRGLLDKPARFDVVSVTLTQPVPAVKVIKNAFDLPGGFIY